MLGDGFGSVHLAHKHLFVFLIYSFAMDCEGLAREWESIREVRDKLYETKKPLQAPAAAKIVEATRQNAVLNMYFLGPILERLSVTEKWALPHLDPLKLELAVLGNKMGMSWGEKTIYQAAVETKRLCGLVRSRAKKRNVTKDSLVQRNVW